MITLPPRFTLFPSTTLFRSQEDVPAAVAEPLRDRRRRERRRDPHERRLVRGRDDDDRALERRAERSEEHTSELQSLRHLVCRLLLEKKTQKVHRREKSV